MKPAPLIVFAVLSLILSRLTFALINDPEGPNLLIVCVLAALIYAVCLAGYFFYSSAKAK